MQTHELFKGTKTEPENFDAPHLVLVQTPGWGVKTPPYSLATLAAYIRQHGYKVLPLDLNLELHLLRREGFETVWEDWHAEWFWQTESCIRNFIEAHKDLIDKHIDCFLKTGAKVFGFSCYSSCIHVSLYYAQELKKRDPSVITIFGGPHVSRNLAGKDVARHPYVDLVAQGEGELTLLEVVRKIAQGESIAGIVGTLHNTGTEVVDNGDRPLIRDLDDLPYAALYDYEFSLYKESHRLPAMASRGCPNRCNFCSEKTYWIAYRGFSAKRIAEEIFHHLDLYPQLREVEFMDSLINGVMARLIDMAEHFKSHPRKFRWVSQAVIRKEMTYDVFMTLKESGCDCLAFGLETSSPDLMVRTGKVLAKGVDIDQLVEDAHRAGLSCAYNFMFGLPGETAQDAEASLEFLHKHKHHIGTVNPSACFCGFSAGTPAYDNPEEFGIIPDPTDVGRYWVTVDGTNNLLVRLARFEAFCKLVQELKIPTTYPWPHLLDRERVIGDFKLRHRDFAAAVEHYDEWLKTNPKDSDVLNKREICLARLSEAEVQPKMVMPPTFREEMISLSETDDRRGQTDEATPW